MNEAYKKILDKNIQQAKRGSAVSAEKGIAHLHEMSRFIAEAIRRETGSEDILEAVYHSDEASRIYRDAIENCGKNIGFAPVNQREEGFFLRQNERTTRLYLCRAISEQGKPHTLGELEALLFGPSSEIRTEGERKVAFLRNRQTFLAFECFAKTLGGVSVLYENNFSDALEAVKVGHAAYAIIPIYSTSDGRLGSFYRMIEKHELSIALTCDIDSDDGESMTTFALVSRERLMISCGTPYFEFQITFDELSRLADILDAAAYFGADIVGLEALPMIFSGRPGTFSVILDLEGADTEGLICYLSLEYPQMSAVGIYGKTEKH